MSKTHRHRHAPAGKTKWELIGEKVHGLRGLHSRPEGRRAETQTTARERSERGSVNQKTSTLVLKHQSSMKTEHRMSRPTSILIGHWA